MRNFLVFVFAIALSSQAAVMAADKAVPLARASKNGFAAIASFVTDPDWRQKWQTDPRTTPAFHTPSVLGPGDKVWLLTLFSGAKLKSGSAALDCDIVSHDPDGTIEKHPAQLCYQGPTPGPAGAIFLTGMEIAIEVTETEASGLYSFDIGLTDANTGVRIPLTVSYEVSGTHPH